MDYGDITLQDASTFTLGGDTTLLPGEQRVPISRDNTLADGVQVISGILFTPSWVEFWWNESATPTNVGGIGKAFASGASSNQCIVFNEGGVSNVVQRVTGSCVVFDKGAPTNSAVVSAFNVDGIDLTWTKTGSPANFTGMTIIFHK